MRHHWLGEDYSMSQTIFNDTMIEYKYVTATTVSIRFWIRTMDYVQGWLGLGLRLGASIMLFVVFT